MTPGSLLPRVTLVVPVRDPASAKSRLMSQGSTVTAAQRERFAAAIALDTVEAAREAELVGELVVVGTLRDAVPGVRVIDDPGAGLIAAIEAGLAEVDSASLTARAVLLGDVPAMRPGDLDRALELGLVGFPGGLSFVADAVGTGTTLAIADSGVSHTLRFGPDSAERHRAAGYRELSLSTSSPLRRDVDTWEELLELRRLHGTDEIALGARTLAELAAL